MAAGMAARDDLLEEIPNMRTTIGNMSDSITRLQTILAGLMEDPSGEYDQTPSGATGDGPVIRARQYQHALDSDRLRFDQLMERVNDLEGTIAFVTAETTRNSQHLENELANMRTEMGATRTSPPFDRRNKNIAETKRFEKL